MKDLEFTENEKIEWIYDVVAGIIVMLEFSKTLTESQMRIVNIADISPSTAGEKCIACILMITGIGFLSMLTSTISTFFFSAIEKRKLKEKRNLKIKSK